MEEGDEGSSTGLNSGSKTVAGVVDAEIGEAIGTLKLKRETISVDA